MRKKIERKQYKTLLGFKGIRVCSHSRLLLFPRSHYTSIVSSLEAHFFLNLLFPSLFSSQVVPSIKKQKIDRRNDNLVIPTKERERERVFRGRSHQDGQNDRKRQHSRLISSEILLNSCSSREQHKRVI
jgi:hypothetical protein